MALAMDADNLMPQKPLRVLVCDDERHIVRLLQVTLERQGFQVLTAFDGREALRAVEQQNPDLVVLDVMMPYLDGYEVLKCLRRDPATEKLPVIMLTARSQDRDVFDAYHCGADLYLTKPFDPMELVTFVKRIGNAW